MKRIRIGTRKSKLAMWQTEWVKNFLALTYPGLEIEITAMETKGDKILDIPLPKIGDKGLFTMELEQALFSGEIDMAVHSLKDLPTALPEGLMLAAYGRREDPRDVFISKSGKTLKELPSGSAIGTSSLRRKTQLQYYREDLSYKDLRGNLQTRWRKLQEYEDMDGIVLAAAGVIRLGWKEKITEYIGEEILLPAVGQGVITVEIDSRRAEMKELLKPLNHKETELAVRAERSFLKSLEGGCQVPIGALAVVNDKTIKLRGIVAGLDAKTVLRISEQGQDPETIGKEAAKKIKSMGAEKILKEIRKEAGFIQ